MNSKIVLCCSFCPLKIDFNYDSLASFNNIVDECVFFNNGLDVDDFHFINSIMTVPIRWYDYVFTDHAKMRNDLIKEVDPDDYIFMIDDTYYLETNLNTEELKKLLVGYNCAMVGFKMMNEDEKYLKIFKAGEFRYIIRYHEMIVSEITNKIDLSDKMLILDIPDEERTKESIERGIKFLKEDLKTYYYDNFIKTHIHFYLANSYFLLGDTKKAMYYYDKVLLCRKDHDTTRRAKEVLKFLNS